MSDQATLFILAGISGLGKSTYADKLYAEALKDRETLLCCPDMWRHELTGDANDQSRDEDIWNRIIPQQIKHNLSAGINVIFDATMTKRAARAKIIALGRAACARVVCHYFAPDLSRALRQNALRDRQVPDWVISRQALNWQEPAEHEGFEEVKEINPELHSPSSETPDELPRP